MTPALTLPLAASFNDMGHRLTGNNSFDLRDEAESSQCLFVCRNYVLCATRILQPSVFWSYSGVIQARTDGVCFNYLTNVRLQDIRPHAMKYARRSFGKRGTVPITI